MLESLYTGRRAHAFADALDEQWPGGTAREGTERGQARADDHPDPPPPPRRGPVLGVDPPPPAGDAADEPSDAELLALTERLRALPRPAGLQPATRAAHRERLLAALAPAERPAPTAHQPLIPRQRAVRRPTAPLPPAFPATLLLRLRPHARLARGLAAGGLTLTVAVTALGGAAAASGDALPGDTLYGLKRGMEDLRLDLATNGTDRGRLHLDRAARRLREAHALAERRPLRPPGRGRTVADLRQALTSLCRDAERGRFLLSRDPHGSPGGTAAAGDGTRHLAAFAVSHRPVWEQLRPRIPAELNDVSADVTALLDACGRVHRASDDPTR